MDIQKLKDRVHAVLLARAKENVNTGCWEWQGATQARSGFGVMRLMGRQFTVHRVAWWVYRPGLKLIDRKVRVKHRCKNHACCNPDHLRLKIKRTRPETVQPTLFNWMDLAVKPEPAIAPLALYKDKPELSQV